MNRRAFSALAASVFAAACGGSDFSSLNAGGDDGGSGDGGGGGDGNAGDGSGNQDGSGKDGNANDSGGSDSGGGDVGADVAIGCDGGLVLCGGQCVDTSSDPNNCGGCGSACTGGTCVAGVCNLLGSSCDGGVPAVGDFACIGIDATNVYVATGRQANNGGQVYKVPIAGGCPQTIVPNQASPHGIASDGTSVFWGANGSGQIWKSDTSGGNATPIVSGQAGPLHLVVDSAGVYWDNMGTQNTQGSVWRADKDGSNAKQLYGSLTAYHVGWVAVDATSVYFPDLLSGTVYSVDKTGNGSAKAMASGQGRPNGMAVDATSLFWTNQTGGQVMKLDLTPNAQPSALATGLSSGTAGPTGLATDGIAAYFVVPAQVNGSQWLQNTGTINKVPVAGGTVTQLSGKQNFPDCISVDTTSVYWINLGGGMISKTGK